MCASPAPAFAFEQQVDVFCGTFCFRRRDGSIAREEQQTLHTVGGWDGGGGGAAGVGGWDQEG